MIGQAHTRETFMKNRNNQICGMNKFFVPEYTCSKYCPVNLQPRYLIRFAKSYTCFNACAHFSLCRKGIAVI